MGKRLSITQKNLSFGIGLRSEHYEEILTSKPRVSWFEALSENYMGLEAGMGGRPLKVLEKVRENYPIVLHGVSLSIGSTDPLNEKYIKRLGELIHRIQPEWVSDHLCWTGVLGKNAHDLLPLPYTEETLHHLVSRIQTVQEKLKRTIALENVSSYVTFEHSQMTEWDFLNEVAERSGCHILLDINNIYVSARNHGFVAEHFLEGISPDKVIQFHLAGHSDCGDHVIDTHDNYVADPVWDLYRKAVQRFGKVPTLLEWDAQIPAFSELVLELKKAEKIEEEVFERSYPNPSAPTIEAPTGV